MTMSDRGELRSMVFYVVLCWACVALFDFRPGDCLFVGVAGLAIRWSIDP